MNKIIDLNLIKTKLEDFFSKRKEVLFAYIFGSLVTKKNNKFSDIDIAIYIDLKKIEEQDYRYGYKAEIITDLMKFLKTDRVDLVLLNSAAPLLRHRVIYFGKLIYNINEKERINFQVETINRYVDYKHLKRKIS
ncbi:MAG: nucleotidyltransferase domain-containing protein [Actinobacteria bacterium]|nr:nucleotidyltransferase domain-containing protein [Actinomycetota bacterium]